MTVDRDIFETAADVTASKDAAVQRMRISPPPLAPVELGNTELRSHAVSGLMMALLSLAALAYLTSASLTVTVGLLLLAAVVVGHDLWRQRRRAGTVGDADLRTHQGRAELEQLADRMWELEESEERFRGLIDALGDLVIHRDRDGRIVYVNHVMADLLQCDAQALVGCKLLDLGIDIGVVPDSAFARGECLSSTDVAIRTEAGTRWYSWIELSVRDKHNDAVSHRAIARDITARKQAEIALIGARERAESANKAKSRFLATVSHEIRTPMNGIMGMAKLLADTRLTAEQRTYVGAVSTSASALLALIEDLLDYSKIEVGRFELESQAVSPRELIENVVELLSPRAYSKSIGLGCHIAPDVPAIITADPGRLRQVLLNVVGNAVKFTEVGGVLVNVSMEDGQAGAVVRISVTDTGPGLKQQDLARIFEEFEQADGTSTRRHGGAGLGLAISRRIIDAMGGTISATGQPGNGCEFAIEIPANSAKRPPEAASTPLSGKNALILSHNLMEAEAIARTIVASDGSATIARTVEEAVLARNGHRADFDIVLVDAALEKADGLTLDHLRNAGFSGVEAVIMIAPTDRGRLPAYRSKGYNTFLARPVRGETLVRILTSGPRTENPSIGVSSASVRRTARLSRLTVLLAEDNEINALLARSALEKGGHTVDVVRNGKAAVDALTAGGNAPRYDVVLMDLHMPVMDGLDAIALIRKHEDAKGIPAVPILVLSADSQENTRHGVIAHGASGFLTKPIDPQALIHEIERHLSA